MPTLAFHNVHEVEIVGVSAVTLNHQDSPEVSVESGWINVGLRVFQQRASLYIISEGQPSGGAVVASGRGSVAIGSSAVGNTIVTGHGHTGSGQPLRGANIQVTVRLPHGVEVDITNAKELNIEGDAPQQLVLNGTTIHFTTPS